MIRAGELNKYVALQSYVETRAADGFPTQTWSTYDNVWAHFRTLSGNERLLAQQLGGILTHEVTIRYRSGVHVDHRILWDSRYFDIKDVRNVDERGEELRLRCVEVVTAGPASSASPSSSVSTSPSVSVSTSPSVSVSASPSASASAS